MWRIPGQQPVWLLRRFDVTPLLPNGANGVLLFFVLSGFTLYLPLATAAREGRAWPPWRHFLLRRALRILPPYWLALALWSPFWVRQHGLTEWPRYLLTHLSFSHTFWPDTAFTISGVLWAMGTIGQFYLLFPVLAPLLRRWPAATALASFALSLGLRLYAPASVPLAASLSGHLADFVLGMYGAHFFVRWRGQARPALARGAWVAAAVALVAFPFWFASVKHDPTAASLWAWQSVLQVPLWAALTVGVALDDTVGARVWGWRPLAWLGLISYSLYLYNYSVQWVPRWLFPHVPANSAAWWVLTFGYLVAVGTAAFLVAEWPLSGWREKVRAPASAAPTSRPGRRG
jgi:peptidoglycan/LPS O-acetylase OafA/YrhL